MCVCQVAVLLACFGLLGIRKERNFRPLYPARLAIAPCAVRNLSKCFRCPAPAPRCPGQSPSCTTGGCECWMLGKAKQTHFFLLKDVLFYLHFGKRNQHILFFRSTSRRDISAGFQQIDPRIEVRLLEISFYTRSSRVLRGVEAQHGRSELTCCFFLCFFFFFLLLFLIYHLVHLKRVL